MSEYYSVNSLPNVHWRYYTYDKELFSEAVARLNLIKDKQDSSAATGIIDSLLESLEKDFKSVSNDKDFLQFVKHLNEGQDTGKYLNLYYTLAKSKLNNFRTALFEDDNAFNELSEYYIRNKASVFFKEAWFYLNKYYASDDFFKAFIDSNTYNNIYNPSIKSNYIERDMYMTILLNEKDAEAILKNVQDKKIDESELSENDLVFLQGLRGVVNKKFLITYKID
jgi:ABC-type glycerol-3-phosphate transport system substrate-binding protein